MAFILPQASFGALGAQKAFATKNIMQPGSRTSNITRANPTFPEWHLKLKTLRQYGQKGHDALTRQKLGFHIEGP